ncbi:MAG: hypothetical protein ABIS36_12960 [Chryseolinea sp.]
MNTRVCLICGKSLLGRSDMIYCSEECRFEAASQRRRISMEPLGRINATLRKNRNILKTLCPSGKALVDRHVLTALGFNTSVFTSLHITSKRITYYICYDFAFTPLVRDGIQKALVVMAWKHLKPWDPWSDLLTEIK